MAAIIEQPKRSPVARIAPSSRPYAPHGLLRTEPPRLHAGDSVAIDRSHAALSRHLLRGHHLYCSAHALYQFAEIVK